MSKLGEIVKRNDIALNDTNSMSVDVISLVRFDNFLKKVFLIFNLVIFYFSSPVTHQILINLQYPVAADTR